MLFDEGLDLDGSQAAEEERRRREEERALRRQYRDTWSTPAGRTVLEDIIEATGVFGDPFTGNAHTYYLLGKQTVGRHILERMQMFNLAGLEEMSDEALEGLLAETIKRRKERENA